MIQSICWQFYIYIATRVLALTEILVTQLVFEHSLRIRFKAETSKGSDSRPVTRTPSRAESPVGSTNTEGAPSDTANPDSEASSIADSTAREASEASTVAVREPSASTSASTLKGTVKVKANQKGSELPKEEEQKGSGNLVGKINNLVTTDLNNIVAARDFLWLSQSCEHINFIGSLTIQVSSRWHSSQCRPLFIVSISIVRMEVCFNSCSTAVRLAKHFSALSLGLV